MKKLAELIQEVDPAALASRSHGRLGQQMAADGAVQVTERGPFIVKAVVGFRNAQVQEVRIDALPKGLRYSCSCSSRKGNFCSHITAVVVFLQAHE